MPVLQLNNKKNENSLFHLPIKLMQFQIANATLAPSNKDEVEKLNTKKSNLELQQLFPRACEAIQ
jgi:hypothetical protein